MSSDSEWNSFTNLLRSSDKDIMEEDEENVEQSLTHKLTSCDILAMQFECHFRR